MEELYEDPNLQQLSVYDISYTSTARRDHYPIRVARIVEDTQDLMTALEEEIARWVEEVEGLLVGLMIQPTKQSSNTCDFNSVKLNS